MQHKNNGNGSETMGAYELGYHIYSLIAVAKKNSTLFFFSKEANFQ
jgi:hypothetical protein